MIVIIEFKIGVFLEDWLHLLAAMDYLKIVSNLIMAYFSIVSQFLLFDP